MPHLFTAGWCRLFLNSLRLACAIGVQGMINARPAAQAALLAEASLKVGMGDYGSGITA